MKKRRKQGSITHQDAVDIIISWHTGQETQLGLAKRYGITVGYVNQLCHGDSRPTAYREAASILNGPMSEGEP